jgi:hypothetical protein
MEPLTGASGVGQQVASSANKQASVNPVTRHTAARPVPAADGDNRSREWICRWIDIHRNPITASLPSWSAEIDCPAAVAGRVTSGRSV